jgi:signal recognition particle subunit SRP72
MPPKPKPKPARSARNKAPAKPKAPLSDAERLTRLFRALCAQIDGGHLANAAKTCDKSARAPRRLHVR